jgi:hypothetical protein
MSYKPEVIADSSGKWCGNALRFATMREADDYLTDLSFRWTAPARRASRQDRDRRKIIADYFPISVEPLATASCWR